MKLNKFIEKEVECGEFPIFVNASEALVGYVKVYGNRTAQITIRINIDPDTFIEGDNFAKVDEFKKFHKILKNGC